MLFLQKEISNDVIFLQPAFKSVHYLLTSRSQKKGLISIVCKTIF